MLRKYSINGDMRKAFKVYVGREETTCMTSA
jgi:hypothetical protein